MVCCGIFEYIVILLCSFQYVYKQACLYVVCASPSCQLRANYSGKGDVAAFLNGLPYIGLYHSTSVPVTWINYTD